MRLKWETYEILDFGPSAIIFGERSLLTHTVSFYVLSTLCIRATESLQFTDNSLFSPIPWWNFVKYVFYSPFYLFNFSGFFLFCFFSSILLLIQTTAGITFSSKIYCSTFHLLNSLLETLAYYSYFMLAALTLTNRASSSTT